MSIVELVLAEPPEVQLNFNDGTLVIISMTVQELRSWALHYGEIKLPEWLN